ncbi:hypothetical protein GCM10011521_14850 [Arenimonas soli]|uniref:Uncharacterized protein n=1 Tax=Arenimonas soli TaxID=2269504 RepID=A0ABQ1HH59_9GAMM|nr:hypothetical protein [Arenimonas soli]GGA77565.1 hypothetical protein GCM10011521_14850 [Arenimonas soli]
MTPNRFSTLRRFVELPDDEFNAMHDKAFERATRILKASAATFSIIISALYIYLVTSTEVLGDTRGIPDALKTAIVIAALGYAGLVLSLNRCVLLFASGAVFRSFAASLQRQ